MNVINLISGPRNLSTAIMYSFAQRNDFTVLDEPFYGNYLSQNSLDIQHPSQKAILNTMELNEEAILNKINKLSKDKNVFIKGMAHHFRSDSPSFILDWKNIILIRHPKKLIASFSKHIENPTINDIGIKKASELFLFLKKKKRTPIIIDSDELMKNPEKYLKKLCALLKIKYTNKMLRWNEGGIPEDGVWATNWYTNVHKTKGFAIQKTKPVELSEELLPLLKKALPYYETLKKDILKND